jgi:hypothetical protein
VARSNSWPLVDLKSGASPFIYRRPSALAPPVFLAMTLRIQLVSRDPPENSPSLALDDEARQRLTFIAQVFRGHQCLLRASLRPASLCRMDLAILYVCIDW